MSADQRSPAARKRATADLRLRAAGGVRHHIWLDAEGERALAELLAAWPFTGKTEALGIAAQYLAAATRGGLQRLDLKSAHRMGAALGAETAAAANGLPVTAFQTSAASK